MTRFQFGKKLFENPNKSAKRTNLIASGESRREPGITRPTLKASNKFAECSSLAGTVRVSADTRRAALRAILKRLAFSDQIRVFKQLLTEFEIICQQFLNLTEKCKRQKQAYQCQYRTAPPQTDCYCCKEETNYHF